jgi:phage/plasmid primase-like uncharacterized protein
MTAAEHSVITASEANVIEQFRDALAGRDIVPPQRLIADSKIHRCDAVGRGGKSDAAYVLHLDGIPAGGFINWRDGLGWENWHLDNGRGLTAAERADLVAKVQALSAKRDQEVRHRHCEAQCKAKHIWDAAFPANEAQAYCAKKKIQPHGCRVSPGREDALIVPVKDTTGEICSLQFIGADSTKRFLTGGGVAGNFYPLGDPGGDSTVIVIAEGFATGASIREATGYAAAVAFDCGNLKPVAKSIRAKFPGARIIIAADDDRLTIGNPGVTKAREAAGAVNGSIAIPLFGPDRPEKATDFNDLAIHLGHDAVRCCIDAALAEDQPPLWPEPDISAARQNRRPPPPLPIVVFGPWWSEWIAVAAEGAACPPDYVAGALLGAASMLIGNSRWVSPWPSWKEPPVLWIGEVGDPSSGKSPGADPVITIVRALEAELAAGFEATHREWSTAKESAKNVKETWAREVADATKTGSPPPIMPETAVDPVEPMRPRIIVSDATAEALGGLLAAHEKGLLFFRDELSGWFNGFGRYSGSGADRAFWIEAYGGRSFTIDRVKHPLPVIIPRLSIGVLGGAQPDRLTELIAGPDDGLPGRFLWHWPEKVPPRRPTRNVNHDAAQEALRKLVELPLVPGEDGGSRPFLCPLADDAADSFDQWREEHAAVEVSGALASCFGKAPGHVLRLALVLEHLWWCAKTSVALPPSRISNAAVLAAAGLVDDYFKPMAERVFGDAALPEGDQLAAVVARWILRERPSVLNARELRRKARLPGLREAEKVRLALGVLVEADWLRSAFERAGGGIGRQREDYLVNPKVYEGDDAK